MAYEKITNDDGSFLYKRTREVEEFEDLESLKLKIASLKNRVETIENIQIWKMNTKSAMA